MIESNKIVICNKKDAFYYNEIDNVLFCLLPYSDELFLENEVGTKRIIDVINEQIMKLNKPEYRDAFKILVSHFAIEEWMPFSSKVVSKNELTAGSHYDLIILGDLHNETYEDFDIDPPIIYTGSTMNTTISDLYNHENCAKVITIEDNQVASEKIKFDKPKIHLVNSENIEKLKDVINSESVIITDNLEIHNNLKDRVIYSMYKPKLKDDQTSVFDKLKDGADEEDEKLDVKVLSLKKIEEDETIDDDTKEFLKFLVSLDVESMTKKELSECVYNNIMKDI